MRSTAAHSRRRSKIFPQPGPPGCFFAVNNRCVDALHGARVGRRRSAPRWSRSLPAPPYSLLFSFVEDSFVVGFFSGAICRPAGLRRSCFDTLLLGRNLRFTRLPSSAVFAICHKLGNSRMRKMRLAGYAGVFDPRSAQVRCSQFF